MGYRSGILVTMLALLLGGCGGGLFSPVSEWPRVGDDFVHRLRWRDYTGAGAYVDESQRSNFLAWTTALEALQPVDGGLESFVFTEQGRRAEAVAFLDYYRLPSARIERWRMVQRWEYQGGGRFTPGNWRLVAPLPELPK